jgi:hypothetical protein
VVGKEMSVSDFFAHGRRELGPDVEQKIQLLCAEGKYLQEIRLSLPKDIVPSWLGAKPRAGHMLSTAGAMAGHR